MWRQPLALRDVAASRLVGWLKRFGVELPMSIEGQISFALQAGIPISSIGEARAYELDGIVTSPKLVVAGVTLLDLSASLRYRDGVMDWPVLRFRLPPRGESTESASITGSGRAQLAPVGDFEIRADVANFDFAMIPELSGAPLPLSGSASGRARVRVAKSDFANLASWSGDAAIATRAVKLPGLNSPSAEAAFRFAGDTLNFERLRGVINDIPLGLAGAVKLAADYRTLALE
ncbi:MAG TPA: hypothetical protein VNC50_23080, partial [Planctomycetia bacterium]|nr:hypothetical protein [Planctomycetia bacterium]